MSSWRNVIGNFTFPEFYSWLGARYPSRVVEVGVNYGQSVAFLAEWLDLHTENDAKIDLVDIGLDRVGHYLDYVAHRIGARHCMPSVEAAKLYADASVDACFIDADHEFAAVTADIAAWKPKIRKGGILAGHDFCNDYPGVIQAVTDAFPEFHVMRCSQWADGHMVDSGGKYFCVWWVEV